jgi:hypothetical protein
MHLGRQTFGIAENLRHVPLLKDDWYRTATAKQGVLA